MANEVVINWFSAKQNDNGEFEYTAEFTDVDASGLTALLDIPAIKVHNAWLNSNKTFTVQLKIGSSSYVIENLLRNLLND